MISKSRTKEILEKAKGKDVLACGDVMLDAYLTGPVKRFSQEAPVPIIPVEEEKFFPGGAGNAAACMAAIGLNPTLVSIVGGRERIKYADILTEECKNSAIKPSFYKDPKRKTTLKLRLAAVNTTRQHVARVDIEDTDHINGKITQNIIKRIKESFEEIKPAALSLHDYDKGLLTEEVFEFIMALSSQQKLPVFADLKQHNFINYMKFIKSPELFYLKPNKDESVKTARLLNGFDKNGTTDEEVIEVAKIIQDTAPIKLVITRGSRGAVYFELGKKPYFVKPEIIEEQFDVAGAGDTVEAFLVASYVGGAKMSEALEIAVSASQVAIRKFGTSIVTEEEVLDWIENN